MKINNRVKELRKLMKDRGISTYIINTSDPHQSEYLAEHYKTRVWISGFTGSAGTVIITEEHAMLWTDGRYFIQGENEIKGTEYELYKMGVPGVPTYIEWLKENLNNGDTLGFNGKIFSQLEVEELERTLSHKKVEFIDEYDLVGEIWEDRPKMPMSKAFIHELKYTGLSTIEKLELVRREMKKEEIDNFILGSLDDIAWLYNIRGRDVTNNPVVISYSLVTMDKAYIFVHGEKIDEDVRNFLVSNGVEIKDYEDIRTYIGNINKNEKVLIEKDKINRWLYKSIPENANIIDKTNITTNLKGKKNPTEIKNQRNAYIKDGVALVKFLYWLDKNIGKKEINEISAGEKLEEFRKEQEGFIEPSFGTISAYGPNAAMAHYSATEESYSILEPKGLYLVDSGGQYYDGTTDITRTMALGPITEEEKRDFTLTLKGHINLIATRFLKGTSGHQLDILCRQPLWEEGLDYKHGTGHGVGYLLNVHEGPHRIASVPNSIPLEKGMVVSIEPGVYKINKHGIRIENIVVVDEDIESDSGEFMKFEILSFCPIDLEAIEISLLTEKEKQWLNNYHKEVYNKLESYLNEEERFWLQEETRSI